MPYDLRLDRELEPELYLVHAVYGKIPGFQSILHTLYSQTKHRDFRGELESVNLFYDSNPETIDFLRRNGVGERVRELLASLPDRQRQVVTLRFGFQDGTIYTQDEICSLIHRERGNKNYPAGESVSRNRVFQIEHKALRRLRNPHLTKNTHEIERYLISLAKELGIEQI